MPDVDRIHEMAEREGGGGETREWRIFGPPGTGKTTNLTRQINRAVQKYGESSVLVTSFSRAAAAELAGRDLPIPRDRVGTLHSHCWHALGGPQIAETNVDGWNQQYASLELTPKKHGRLDGEDAVEDDNEAGGRNGDKLLAQLSRFRGMLIQRSGWPGSIIEFERLWSTYKREQGLLDFCDLIETCLKEVPIAPNNPSVIFADEAQDLNAMQLKLVRRWGENAEYFIIAGDEDQTIFSFCGATPEAFLDPEVPQDHKIILKQSYRLPRAVHALANQLISQVSRRQPKEYLPRDAEGQVERLTYGTFLEPGPSVMQDIVSYVDAGRTVMFLASCSYMLKKIVQALRDRGIPYHNPYRRSNGFWNPIKFGTRGAMPNRILALLCAHPDFGEDARPWTNGDLALWAELLKTQGVMRHGVKKNLQAADLEAIATYEHMEEIFETPALEELLGCFEGGHKDLLAWWKEHLTFDAGKRAEFPTRIAVKHGPRALLRAPQVIVGTIHSVKGGEADVVVVVPDLSSAAAAQYQIVGPPRDAVTRLMYVALTRAKEKVVICRSVGPAATI